MNCRASSQETAPRNVEILHQLGGAFPGDALSFEQLEREVYRFWKPKWISREKELQRTAWFDYRMVHPALRSHFFFNQHTLAFRRALKRYWDDTLNTYGMRPSRYTTLYAAKPGYITSVISVMHRADALGVPYDVFFDAGYRHMMQERQFRSVWQKNAAGLRGHKLPPITVFQDGELLLAVQKHFERVNLSRLRLPLHPTYLAERRAALPHQLDFVDYLIHNARLRGEAMPEALSVLIYERGLLLESEVEARMGREILEATRAKARFSRCNLSQR